MLKKDLKRDFMSPRGLNFVSVDMTIEPLLAGNWFHDNLELLGNIKLRSKAPVKRSNISSNISSNIMLGEMLDHLTTLLGHSTS